MLVHLMMQACIHVYGDHAIIWIMFKSYSLFILFSNLKLSGLDNKM